MSYRRTNVPPKRLYLVVCSDDVVESIMRGLPSPEVHLTLDEARHAKADCNRNCCDAKHRIVRYKLEEDDV